MNIYSAGDMTAYKHRYYGMDQSSNIAVIDGRRRGVVCLAGWFTKMEY